VGPSPSGEQNRQLALALSSFAARTIPDDFSALEQFLSERTDSPWAPVLLFNLGVDYSHTGWFSKALAAWEKAWPLLKDSTDLRTKAIADRAAGELAMMYGRFGQTDELAAFLSSLEGRVFAGPATEKITGAREGLWSMRNRPSQAFRCGPIALDRIRASQDAKAACDLLIYHSRSTTNGYSLAQLARLSYDLGMHYQMVRRLPKSALPVPSVVHLKVGHYAALVKEAGGNFLLQDPTFGSGASIWVSPRALEEEASGLFLVPEAGGLPSGFRAVSEAEGARVWGRGSTGQSDQDADTPDDKEDDDDKPCKGMAAHSIHLMLVSLNIKDSPVGYSPPVGPAVRLLATYNQREAGQPAVFSYSNLGPKWTFNWLAYITDNPGAPGGDVKYYTDGGGSLPFSGFDNNSQTYSSQLKSQALLKRTSPTSYEMLFRDGSKRIFSQPDSAGGISRRVFMTALVDPYGNRVSIFYDAGFRIIAVQDAIGQATSFLYQDPRDELRITKVVDPFGRQAQLEYDASGRLSSIQDCIGLVSSFAYDAGTFIQAMTTPYGTTAFAYGETGAGSDRNRWLEVTYPTAEKERVEYSETGHGIPIQDPASTVPQGLLSLNYFLNLRQTAYWNRGAYPAYLADTNSYSKAHVYHWLHSPDFSTATGVLESEKLVLESRVWYNYPGQVNQIVVGTSSRPSVIGRVLDDGTTQLRRFGYNAIGNVTNSIDPVGRSITYIYSPDLIDLLEVRQTTGTNNELLARYLYNSQHLRVAVWDAAGQMTTNTYNSCGQLLTTSDPLGETRTFSYNTDGYLLSIDGTLPGTNDVASFTYDSCGRLSSKRDADGYILKYAYDDLDRPTRITYPDNTSVDYYYYKLDRNKSRDRQGRVLNYTHDALRRLSTTQDALKRTTTFQYCGCGAVSAVIDSMGRKTLLEYDVQGRLSAIQYPDGARKIYNYESTTSRLLSTADQLGQFKLYVYNLDDTLASLSYANTKKPTPTVTFTYDACYKRRTSMQDGIGMTTWMYHPAGTVGALQPALVRGPWPDTVVTYKYDVVGRLKSRKINEMEQVYSYDAAGRPISELNALGGFQFDYDGATYRVVQVTYPNGQKAHYDYFNDVGDHRLKQIISTNPDNKLLSRFTYGYDRNGNITNWIQETGSTMEEWRIASDEGDQLLDVTIAKSGTNISNYKYEYDLAGNRIRESINDVSQAYSYNSVNQLLYASDETATNVRYEWDAEQRLVAVVSGLGRSEFYYDGLGRRARIVEKTAAHGQSDFRYVWCDLKLCEEQRSDGAIVTRFFEAGEQFQGTNTFYVLDHLGSVRQLIDAHGQSLRTLNYDPYGRLSYFGAGESPRRGFTGHLYHSPSGLLLAPYRAYSPEIGRWLSRDLSDEPRVDPGPGGVVSEVGEPNLYLYTGNAPVTFVDRLGLKRTCPECYREYHACTDANIVSYWDCIGRFNGQTCPRCSGTRCVYYPNVDELSAAAYCGSVMGASDFVCALGWYICLGLK